MILRIHGRKLPVPCWRTPASANASTARALMWVRMQVPQSMARMRQRHVQGCGEEGILLAQSAPCWHPVKEQDKNIPTAAVR